MLTRLSPIEFVRPATAGRTRPSVIVCERPAGEPVEVIAKFSAGCDQGVTNLAREAIAACLAGDLGLPVPEPFLIDVPAQWADLVRDPERHAIIRSSAPVAFGSRHITGQYVAWTRGHRIPDAMLATAAATFVFDAITGNPDRRTENPNCLVKGDEIRIFDHEMAFTQSLVLGWRPPWTPGGLKHLERRGSHILREQLRRRAIDFGPIRRAWLALSDRRVAAYGQALPAEWAAADAAARQALAQIREGRDEIDGCLAEVKRVLECRTAGPTATRS